MTVINYSFVRIRHYSKIYIEVRSSLFSRKYVQLPQKSLELADDIQQATGGQKLYIFQYYSRISSFNRGVLGFMM